MLSYSAELISQELMSLDTRRGESMPDRRQMRRYEVDWPFRVKGTNPSGLGILDTGVLRNISSRGAFGFIGRPLAVGMKIEVLIRLPMNEERWIKYSAEVIRVEQLGPQTGVALRFDTSRPVFYSK